MGITAKIKSKIATKQKESEQSSGKKLSFFALIIVLIKGFINIILAKWYLRKCTKVGSLVSVTKKPIIKAQGKIFLADEVRIRSFPVKAKLLVDKGSELHVGKNSRINGAHISVSSKIVIGENVRIAPYVILIDNDYHKVDDHFSEEGTRGEIIIEDDVWIAMSAKIMKGVRIGKGSVVAMGALVTKDVPAYSVVAGVPAKVLKTIKPKS
ncbi:MAG: acyltransferase [Bacteroidota bacterium]|nr:acyltransferase [Bacteroidota bacterium]